MSRYQTPQATKCGLKIEKQTLSQAQAQEQWQALISQGFEGWAQHASAVLRCNASTPLSKQHGGLIAGECYQGLVSYKLQQIGNKWNLSRFERIDGNQYQVIERSFFAVEPSSGSDTALSTLHQAVSYEVFWPSSQHPRFQNVLQSPNCEQTRPICARLISL